MMTLFSVEYAETADVCSSAIISPDGAYRYSLARWWGDGPRDLWIMCNPSTADARVDDATIRRCAGFSRSFGSGGFVVVNVYGYRATKPAAMWAAQANGMDIIGPENDSWITAHCVTESGRVIVAWGAHPKPERCGEVLRMIVGEGREPLCLGTTVRGMPRHPLMLRSDTELQSWPTEPTGEQP